MISRYSLPPMKKATAEYTKFRTWREVEAAAAQAQGAPHDVVNEILHRPGPALAELHSRELETGHDVVAFLQAWNERLSPQARPWLHRGMTSSDLVDTANSLMIQRAGRLLTDESFGLFDTAVESAHIYRLTVRVGRTHGQHAEITTWGHWLANFAHAAYRAHTRLERALQEMGVAKLSGPVGDYKQVDPNTEKKFAQILGLKPERAATQVVHRDRYADLVWACSQAATLVESLAVEVRLGQQTEVSELFEHRPGTDPTGSSAMPHKRNPIASEQLCGLARLVRSNVLPVQEGVVLWHERDISHSSVERVALWDAIILTHYMLARARHLLSTLQVDQERMEHNAYEGSNGRILSSFARSWLVEAGISDPQVAWKLVAEASLLEYPLVEAVITTAAQWSKAGLVPASFQPDWVKFREEAQVDRQVSPGDQATFRHLEMMRRVATQNRAERANQH